MEIHERAMILSTVDKVKMGECFRINNILYMRVYNSTYDAVKLSDGTIKRFPEGEICSLEPRAKIVIE